MFGPFKPTAPLSGGLLWKIPWRLSSHQKYRHRKRLQKVDNVVAVLDNALRKDAKAYQALSEAARRPASATTMEDLASAPTSLTPRQAALRNGKGPRQGDFVPQITEATSLADNPPLLEKPSRILLSDQARAVGTFKKLERWKAEMPTEAEMLAKNKYTIFDRKVRGYRKGIHKLPKWTRQSQRLNPPGY